MSTVMQPETVPPEIAKAAEAHANRTAMSKLWERSQTLFPTLVAFVLLVAMLIFAQISYGKVFHAGTLSSLLVSFAPTIILAVGMTIVILSGGIDLSVGAVVACSSVAGVMLINAGLNPWLAMIAMILIGALFGLVSGVMIQYFNVQPFIATLAMMFLARGLASILATKPVVAPKGTALETLATDWKLYDGPKVNDFTITPGLLIALLVIAGGVFLMHRTRVGRTVYAIGGNENSAQLMGLPVAKARVMIYVLSGALAALAGVIFTSEVGGKAQNVTGLGWELDAIAAVVIGGTLLTGGAGYVLGSLVGVFVLAALNLIITKDGGINPEYLTIIKGAVLLAFVLLQRVLSRRSKQ